MVVVCLLATATISRLWWYPRRGWRTRSFKHSISMEFGSDSSVWGGRLLWLLTVAHHSRRCYTATTGDGTTSPFSNILFITIVCSFVCLNDALFVNITKCAKFWRQLLKPCTKHSYTDTPACAWLPMSARKGWRQWINDQTKCCQGWWNYNAARSTHAHSEASYDAGFCVMSHIMSFCTYSVAFNTSTKSQTHIAEREMKRDCRNFFGRLFRYITEGVMFRVFVNEFRTVCLRCVQCAFRTSNQITQSIFWLRCEWALQNKSYHCFEMQMTDRIGSIVCCVKSENKRLSSQF